AAAALVAADGHLPDEEAAGTLRRAEPEQETDHLAVAEGHPAGGCELLGHQHVGVGGVQIQLAAIASQRPHGCTVASFGSADEQRGRCGGCRIRTAVCRSAVRSRSGGGGMGRLGLCWCWHTASHVMQPLTEMK